MNSSCKKSLTIYLYQYGGLLLLSIGLLLFLLQFCKKEEQTCSFGDYMVSSRETKELIYGKKETEDLAGKSAGLHLNGYEVPFDKEKQIFYISQPLSGETWQGNLKPYGAELYIPADAYMENLSQAINDGHIFEAILCEGNRYQKAGIVLTGMPVVKIDTVREEPREYPIEDIENYVFNSETRYYGQITIFQSGVSALSGTEAESRYQILQRKVCYHERGQNSAAFQKKSYAVKLLNQNEKGVEESLFGMQESKKWKMLAMYSDPNKIRDKVSMDIWKEIAEGEKNFRENGPEMEYCEVILDGEYLGIYGMMLPVDENTLELGQGDVLYKVLDWYMPGREETQASVEQNYRVCYPIRIRYPEKSGSVEKMWEPLNAYFSGKYWSIDFNAYADMTYAENLADFYIFIQTVSGFDNYLKNTYISAKTEDNATGYKMITIPWDLNYTFGNCYVYEPDNNYTEFNADSSVNYVEPVLEQVFRFNADGEAEVLKERWENYRAGILSTEHIIQLLQDNMDYMQDTGAFERDTEKWEQARNDSDLSEVKDYVEERMRYLDGYFGGF